MASEHDIIERKRSELKKKCVELGYVDRDGKPKLNKRLVESMGADQVSRLWVSLVKEDRGRKETEVQDSPRYKTCEYCSAINRESSESCSECHNSLAGSRGAASLPLNDKACYRRWIDPGMSLDALEAIDAVTKRVSRWKNNRGCYNQANSYGGELGKILGHRVKIVTGFYGDDIHAWVEIDGEIFDPTAGQFEDYPAIDVDKYSR